MERLFHISENPKIKVFEPRPSPSPHELIVGDVVFAICERLLHNYILPRDCPRVTYYAGEQTTQEDKLRYLGSGNADFVIALDKRWYPAIQRTTLFCYEFPTYGFNLIDPSAGYYVTYSPVIPIAVKPIYNILEELLQRNIELRFMPAIDHLGEEVKQSSLNFSLIRLRNLQSAHLHGL